MAETQSAPATSDVALMQAVIAEHGDEALASDENESRRGNFAASRQAGEGSTPEATGGRTVLPPEDLDPATLEALGLTPPGEPAEEDDGEEGDTERSTVDLEAVASVLGLDASDISATQDGLRIKTKVDGETYEVTPAELRKGYQLQSHFTRQQEQFLAERQAWEQARQQQQQQLQGQAMLADQILQQEDQALDGQYTKDWDSLRKEDPAEYAAQVAEYNQRKGDIRKRRENLVQGFVAAQQEQSQRQLQQLTQQRDYELQALVHATGWNKPEVFQENANRLRSYLVSNAGFHPEEVDTVLDHRALLLMEKARRYDDMVRRVNTSRKKVTAAPRVPTGTASRPAGGRQRKLEQAKNRLSQEHSEEAAAEVFKQLGVI